MSKALWDKSYPRCQGTNLKCPSWSPSHCAGTPGLVPQIHAARMAETLVSRWPVKHLHFHHTGQTDLLSSSLIFVWVHLSSEPEATISHTVWEGMRHQDTPLVYLKNRLPTRERSMRTAKRLWVYGEQRLATKARAQWWRQRPLTPKFMYSSGKECVCCLKAKAV